MTQAKVFISGNSQTVRPPKEFRFQSNWVEIFRRGNEVVLHEIPATALDIFNCLSRLPDDFMQEGREEELRQERKAFWWHVIYWIPI